MQYQTAVEYQRFVDRWFKFCVRLTLDPVSARIRGGIVVQVLALA